VGKAKVVTKEQLQKHVKNMPDRSVDIVEEIALKHGKLVVLKTPPYHCELQPIEKTWAVVKNMVAYKVSNSMTVHKPRRMLISHFYKIPSSTFVSVWRTSIDNGRQLQAMGDNSTEPAAGTSTSPRYPATTGNLVDLTDDEGDLDWWDKDLLDLTEEDYARAFSAVEAQEPHRALTLEP
ncbi:hypothetical protein BGZ58_004602, partial [Dissophora ornata]